ncbi:MAG: hypothetical protein KatS3mg095_0232 [Candidatus Parcubacteria bacterium]|nr:MAG: hypothetical protein KatS3mg095_0232 [Candidatus Parcubacteria bacterium]
MIKKDKKNKSFTIQETMIAFLIFLIFLGTIINSYLAIINSNLINQRRLIAIQNLKTALDKIYLEIKTGANFSTSTNIISFLNTNNCNTTTISFATDSNNLGYLSIYKNNATSELTDRNLINITEFNIHTAGIIQTANPTLDIISHNTSYNLIAPKSITISIKGNINLKESIRVPINIQLTTQPFNSFNKQYPCYF